MKVINLYGGPGTGKSTTAAGLFQLMKLESLEAELVTEYAKDLVWSERHTMFSEQDYIFAKQNHRLRRLRNKVDWVVTDCPLLLGFMYMNEEMPGRKHFENFMRDMFNSYNNINIFLQRTKEYNPNGRNQTEKEAIAIDLAIMAFLIKEKLPFITIPADKYAPQNILSSL